MILDIIRGIDASANAAMVLLHNPLLTQLMMAVTSIASVPGMIIQSAILLCILAYRRQRYHVALVILSMGVGQILKLIIKYLVQRARPENALVAATEYSFPSGHATMATIFFLLIIYLFRKEFHHETSKNLFVAGNLALIILIGASRVYLNVHWLNDVIAGFVLGAVWFMVSVRIMAYIRKNHYAYSHNKK